MFFPVLVGGTVGFVIGYCIYKKMQRTNDLLIDEINRFKNEGVDD